jgi:hypothetical protein
MVLTLKTTCRKMLNTIISNLYVNRSKILFEFYTVIHSKAIIQ